MLNRDEEEKVDYTKLEITSISDLLIELDSVKRELYEQIEANKVIKLEKQKLKKEFHDMESEMQATIQGYWEVLESQQLESSGDSFRVKQQLVDQQNLTERLQMENGALNEQLLVLNDENKTLMKRAESYEQAISKLNKKVQKYKSQNGVPSSQVKKLEDNLEKAHREIENLRAVIAKCEGSSFSDKKMIQQLETEKLQLTNYLNRKEKDEGKYKKALKEKNKSEKKLEKDLLKMSERIKVAEDWSKLQEENEALISQKNVLLKFKETIGRELEKLKQENEKKTKQIEDNQQEFVNFKAEAERAIERLRSANERLGQENLELENENMALQKEHKSLEKKFIRLSNAAVSDPRISHRDKEDEY